MQEISEEEQSQDGNTDCSAATSEQGNLECGNSSQCSAAEIAATDESAAVSTQADECTAVNTALTPDTATTEGTKKHFKLRKPTRAEVIEYIKRWVFLCVGLFIMSFGVGFSIKATLGTSPISSIPKVLDDLTPDYLDIGQTTIIINTIIVLIQIVILRRKFKLIQLLQIPVCVVFGYLCNLSEYCLTDFEVAEYWQQWLLCIAGIVLVAVGVSFEVAANVTTLAGEGLALALNATFPKIKFGYMKVICDCSLVIIAVVISLSCSKTLLGVREGTVAAAIFVGLLAKQFAKVTVPIANKIFDVKKQENEATATDGKALHQGAEN